MSSQQKIVYVETIRKVLIIRFCSYNASSLLSDRIMRIPLLSTLFDFEWIKKKATKIFKILSKVTERFYYSLVVFKCKNFFFFFGKKQFREISGIFLLLFSGRIVFDFDILWGQSMRMWWAESQCEIKLSEADTDNRWPILNNHRQICQSSDAKNQLSPSFAVFCFRSSYRC